MTVESTTTFSAREFNQDVSAAKRAADHAPVMITDRGEPAYVLMSIEEYRSLRPSRSIAEAIGMRTGPDLDFDPEPLHSRQQAADL